MRGKFIVIEGIDGSGKDTQLDLLADRMKSNRISFVKEKQPTTSPIGTMIRINYLSGDVQADEMTVRLLFLADCYDHITKPNGLLDVLNNGLNVICCRYYYSNIAYGALSQPLSRLIEMNEWNSSLLRPDLILFLDISAEEAMNRIIARSNTERYETLDKLAKVSLNYRMTFNAMEENSRVVMVNGELEIPVIHDTIWDHVSHILKEEV